MSKRENRIWLALLIATVLSLIGYGIASADVGSQEICADVTGLTTHDQPIQSNHRASQTFTPGTTFTISGVKLPLQRTGAAAGSILIEVNPTSGGYPDINTVLASVIVSQSELPLASGGATDQSLDCESDSGYGTVFEFSSPAVLSGSVQYAITVFGVNGTQWGIIPALSGGSTLETELGVGAQSWECNELLSTCSNPGSPDWGKPYGTNQSSGIAIYNTVQPTPTRGTVDSWLDNFLASMGLDSAFGKTLAGSLFVMIIFVVLAIKGIPWIISLGIAGFAVTFLTAAAIFDPSILLGLLAIVMLGGIGLIFALIVGGGETNV